MSARGGATSRRYVGGFVFMRLATQWVRVAHPMMYFSWLAFALVLPLFWLLALDFIRRARPARRAARARGARRVGRARIHADALPDRLPVPQAARALPDDRLRLVLPRLHAARVLLLIQIADLGGVYAVSFVVAAVNGLVADWRVRLTTRAPRHGPAAVAAGRLGRRRRRSCRSVARRAAVVACVRVHRLRRTQRLEHPAFADGPRVAAIQGSIAAGARRCTRGGSRSAQTYANLHVAARPAEAASRT